MLRRTASRSAVDVDSRRRAPSRRSARPACTASRSSSTCRRRWAQEAEVSPARDLEVDPAHRLDLAVASCSGLARRSRERPRSTGRRCSLDRLGSPSESLSRGPGVAVGEDAVEVASRRREHLARLRDLSLAAAADYLREREATSRIVPASSWACPRCCRSSAPMGRERRRRAVPLVTAGVGELEELAPAAPPSGSSPRPRAAGAPGRPSRGRDAKRRRALLRSPA